MGKSIVSCFFDCQCGPAMRWPVATCTNETNNHSHAIAAYAKVICLKHLLQQEQQKAVEIQCVCVLKV